MPVLKSVSSTFAAASVALAAMVGAPAFAQGGNFSLELNAARDAGEGCRLTYVATNNTGQDLEQASYEVAVFDQDGVVSRLLILEFGRLQADKTKVVQFDLSDMACTNISRLLVNSVSECVATGGGEANCMDGLVTSSRAEIQFGL